MCAAAGGLLATAIKVNLGSEAVAFSLTTSEGGYNVLITGDKKTMCELFGHYNARCRHGGRDTPEKHPDAGKFLPLPKERDAALRFSPVVGQ
jgi:hypothetical protein